MTYVVTEPCLGTKDRSCVEVCPVDCFYDHTDSSLNDKAKLPASDTSGPGMLVIHPDECIHCGACEPECPVEAIFEDTETPEKWNEYVELNESVCNAMDDDALDACRVTEKG